MTFTVAIVGRPNVGKSTLFNRLIGKRLALVDDTPGVTRDWREGEGRIADMAFRVLDTAGLEDAAAETLAGRMRGQTEQALLAADVVLFLIDARAGITPLDEYFAGLLRKRGTPVILVANKCEGRAGESGLLEAFSLGLGDPVPVSAEHGEGMADLFEALQPYAEAASVPAPSPTPPPQAGEGLSGRAAQSPSPGTGGGVGEGVDGALPDEKRAIRYALAAVKTVGAAAMAAVVAEREASGAFRDIMEFAERIDPRQINKRQLESLAAAGAFECLGLNRREAFDAIEAVLRYAGTTQAERDCNQVSLFAGTAAAAQARPPVARAPEWPVEERLQREFEALGFYLSAHPLESHAKLCARLGVVEWAEVASGAARESRVKLAGIVTGRRLTTSSRGSRMAFVQMSDASGGYEVTLFAEVLAGARELLEAGKPLLVTVEVQRNGEDIRLTAQSVELLEEVATHAAAGLRIFVNEPEPLDSLATVFRDHGGRGKGRVSVVLSTADREVELELRQRYAISPAMRGAIKSIPGIIDVQDL